MRLRRCLFAISLFVALAAKGQLLSWQPQFASATDNLTITVDANFGNKGLLGHTPGDVYVHTGVITNLSSSAGAWRYVKFNQNFNQPNAALQATSLGNNRWQFTITNIRAYYGVPAEETIQKIAILFRSGNGAQKQANTDASDMYITVQPNAAPRVTFVEPYIIPAFNPSNEPIAAGVGTPVTVRAVASGTGGALSLYYNGLRFAGPTSGTQLIEGSYTANATGGQWVVAEYAINGAAVYDTLRYNLLRENTIAPLPAGVREGINYGADCSSVTLVLFAPFKNYAFVLGEFAGNNWQENEAFQMNKTPDGNYYWLTIGGIAPGAEYAYQYLVDGNIYIADPYCEKVLDPDNDRYIPAVTYPNLKPYPTHANVSGGKNGYISILQSCAPQYAWKVEQFKRPAKKDLIVYELLVRDFHERKNYQTLIDSFAYFKKLGVNAIELMPVNEFGGNESWGYDPKFYCAPDKAYGTKDKLKEFIDLCHQNGIAVILDVVYNQMDAFGTPQGKLYWDNGPAANSPWFNRAAPHPYNVFQDLNHTQPATQYLIKRALDYWIEEYRVDGYRIDLAKGFTQKCTNGVNATCPVSSGSVEDYDAGRVAILKGYYDHVISKYPETYMILEFLGSQNTFNPASEEATYANYGFLLWGNNNYAYSQAVKGVANGSNFSKIVYNSNEQSFSVPAQVGYMESHDEERLMYRTLTEGNIAGSYNVKALNTALARQAAAACVFFTVPGPKMVWQFGERGYDLSINYNGSNVANKPPRWEYMADNNRLALFDTYSKLISLRLAHPQVFASTQYAYDFYDNGGLVKRFQIADANPAGLKVMAMANLDVVAQTRQVNFQAAGDWYQYVSNGTGAGLNAAAGQQFSLTSASASLTLQPGEYHVYISHPANVYMFIGKGNWTEPGNWTYGRVPPTPLPAGSEIIVSPQAGGECLLNTGQTLSQGSRMVVSPNKYLTVPAIQ